MPDSKFFKTRAMVPSAVLGAALLLTPASPPVAAQTERYVSDQLEITLRRGPGTRFAIRQMLKSGTPVQVLEDNGEGYAKVTAPDGTTGWVLTRFLLDEPAARDKLAENARKMEDMQQEVAAMQEQLLNLKQLETDLSRTQSENEALRTELKRVKGVAADSLKINEQNQALTQALEKSKSDQQALLEKNMRLSDETQQNWFLAGAGVIILGMLIGLAIPKIRWKQRRSSGGGIRLDF